MHELVLALDIGSSSAQYRSYNLDARYVSSTFENTPCTRAYSLGSDGTMDVPGVGAVAGAVVDDCPSD